MAIDEAKAAEALFGGTAHRDTEISEPDLNAPATVERNNTAWRDTLNGIGMSDQEGVLLTGIVKRAAKEPVDDAQARAWRTDTQESLRREFGAGDEIGSARHRLKLAQELVNKNPSFKKLLADTKLADEPQIARLLVDKAWSMRAAGRL